MMSEQENPSDVSNVIANIPVASVSNDNKYDKLTQTLVSKFEPLIRSWKASDVGNWNNWLELLNQVMKMVQSGLMGEGGIVKSTVAINVVQGLAQIFIDQNVGKLDEQQLKTVRLVLSDDGANLLKASTGILKKLMKMLDTNNDGRISQEEVRSCWKKFFGCCF